MIHDNIAHDDVKILDNRNLGLNPKIVSLRTLEVNICIKIEFSIIYGSHFVFGF